MNQLLTSQIRKFNTLPIPHLSVGKRLNAEQPYTRLLNLGPKALSDAEILSLVLESGLDGGSALQLARQLIRKFGGISELGALSVHRLAKEPGMTIKSAVRVLTGFEFASRCAEDRMSRMPMNSSEAIYQIMAPRLAHKKDEYVFIILLDAKLQALRIVELSKGNSNTALCEPRDLLHEVIMAQVSAFVMVHNHPSGDPAPSRQDLALTKKIQQASQIMNLRFVDHLIIGRRGEDRYKAYYSFAEAGVL